MICTIYIEALDDYLIKSHKETQNSCKTWFLLGFFDDTYHNFNPDIWFMCPTHFVCWAERERTPQPGAKEKDILIQYTTQSLGKAGNGHLAMYI